MSSNCDRSTFEAVLKNGLVMTRGMARHSENGRVAYVPDGWEVYDLSGKLYGKGHTPEGAIDAAYVKIARPHVWRLLAPPAED